MEIRALTRKEQLLWLKELLEKQIKRLQQELEECNQELEDIERTKIR